MVWADPVCCLLLLSLLRVVKRRGRISRDTPMVSISSTLALLLLLLHRLKLRWRTGASTGCTGRRSQGVLTTR